MLWFIFLNFKGVRAFYLQLLPCACKEWKAPQWLDKPLIGARDKADHSDAVLSAVFVQ